MALGILEVAGQQPVDRPVAAAHASERVHRLYERVSLVGCDPIFDDDEHRPGIGRDRACHVIARPWVGVRSSP